MFDGLGLAVALDDGVGAEAAHLRGDGAEARAGVRVALHAEGGEVDDDLVRAAAALLLDTHEERGARVAEEAVRVDEGVAARRVGVGVRGGAHLEKSAL